MDYITAKQKAIKYIGLSKKTEQEVKNKLLKLEVQEDIIAEVITNLISIGYIDDVTYANLYIKQCLKEEKKTKNEIMQKLLQKGIKEGIIENSLDSIPETYQEKVKENIIKAKSKSLNEEKLNKYLCSKGLIEYKEWE